MAPKAGILYVTMQPEPTLSVTQFHDWYNNEHGPLRIRLDSITNGFRYRAKDLPAAGSGTPEKPEWMAIYDVVDMAETVKAPYITLREDGVKSPREVETMSKIKVDRRFFDHFSTRQSKDFKEMEDVAMEGKGRVLLAACIKTKPGTGDQLDKFYEEEHIELFTKIPGWLRTRRFVTAGIEGKDDVEYLALHDFAHADGLDGEEMKTVRSTPWYEEIQRDVVKDKLIRSYDLYYTFGPAPRDLAPLESRDIKEWTYTDGLTRTIPSSDGGAIESYVTTKDGVDLPYRLEGSSDPQAPLILLSNCILADWHIWDGFIVSFFSEPQNRKYRILRYLTRGRSSKYGKIPITVDVLASDIIALLDALRIPKAAALIGVSLGGATVLNTALNYPDRVSAFVSCDTSSKSPALNSKLWGERIEVSEKEGAKTKAGEAVVGGQLAEMTTRRWFVKESYDGGKLEETIGKVNTMVETNSLEGFKKSVEALFEYDMKEAMKGSLVKGAFFVGSGDGVLPGVMKEMAAEYGSGAQYVVIDGAGHLPMVEKPHEFSQAITKFLAG